MVDLSRKSLTEFKLKVRNSKRNPCANYRKEAPNALWILCKKYLKGGAFSKPKKVFFGMRNSVVKVSYMSNSYGKQWKRHGHYLARESAQIEKEKGLGFNAKSEALDIPQVLDTWQQANDIRVWKLIVSPEDGAKLELKSHVREVMKKAECDFGTPLEWMAIAHYNTDNPHAHLVIRGIKPDGKELRISKVYFTQGFRANSRQAATRSLGLRLESDVLKARQKMVRQLDITALDFEIKRKLEKDHIVLVDDPKEPFEYKKQSQIIERLMFLENLGTAKKIDSITWKVDPDHMYYLKELSRGSRGHKLTLGNPE